MPDFGDVFGGLSNPFGNMNRVVTPAATPPQPTGIQYGSGGGPQGTTPMAQRGADSGVTPLNPIATGRLDLSGRSRGGAGLGGPQPLGQGGSSVGQGMTQPMGGDLQEAPIQGAKGQKLGFMDALGQVETKGGMNMRNPLSPSHVGKYQMNSKAFQRFGGGGNINDPTAQHVAAQNYINYNRDALKRLTGRDPTDAEVYLSYNQGLHGAYQLLSNPDKPAGSLVKPQNILNQGGDPRAPASQFIQMIAGKWDAAAGGGQTLGGLGGLGGGEQTRNINPDAFAPPAQRFTNKGAQQTGSTEQVLKDMQRDEAIAPSLRSPPDMGAMEGQ